MCHKKEALPPRPAFTQVRELNGFHLRVKVTCETGYGEAIRQHMASNILPLQLAKIFSSMIEGREVTIQMSYDSVTLLAASSKDSPPATASSAPEKLD
jgi:hypothetical protein